MHFDFPVLPVAYLPGAQLYAVAPAPSQNDPDL